ncbi:MAG TPA: glycosyltransferase family 1 protein, partial [Acidimicrobiia bacterium]|nr:glycosyltransferase family 1 protein [Acidimicrobiia bacterium]
TARPDRAFTAWPARGWAGGPVLDSPPVRLLLDVSAVPARPAGAGVYTCRLAEALDRLGECELHLLARRRDAGRWHDLAPGAAVHALVPAARPARLAWEQVRAPAVAARLGVDVWHGPHYTVPLRLRLPAVTTIHDLTFLDHPEWHERSKVVFFRRMIPASAARAAAIVAVSGATARAIDEMLEPVAPVLTIAHGVDHDRFRPAPAGDPDDLARLDRLGVRPPYVAFVGTMEPRKAVPTLVEAFARLAADHPDVRLVLAGADGWGTEEVRATVAASGVATRVLRVRWVPDEALPALLRQAAAVAYPSHEEGFGLPALEALASGAPLVTSAESPMAEIAGPAALLVPSGNAGALAWALNRVLSDADVAARLRREGPAAAAPYTWEASARLHLDAYRLAVKVAEERP